MSYDNLTNDELTFITECIYMAAEESFYSSYFNRAECEALALSISAKLGIDVGEMRTFLYYH